MGNEVLKLKKMFYHPSRVQKAMDRKTFKVLAKFGAFTRRIAQTSMKKKKGHAPKGQPPFAHKNPLLRKLYFFVINRKTKTVVTGPVRLGKTSDLHLPKVLEGGGKLYLRRKSGETYVANHPPRPYTGPAASKNLSNIGQWYKEL